MPASIPATANMIIRRLETRCSSPDSFRFSMLHACSSRSHIRLSLPVLFCCDPAVVSLDRPRYFKRNKYALHRLSLSELVKDKSPDGAFSAGAQWPGVWTRDISYSDQTGCAKVRANSYSVPLKAGSLVEARVSSTKVEFRHDGKRIASHARCADRRRRRSGGRKVTIQWRTKEPRCSPDPYCPFSGGCR